MWTATHHCAQTAKEAITDQTKKELTGGVTYAGPGPNTATYVISSSQRKKQISTRGQEGVTCWYAYHAEFKKEGAACTTEAGK